MLQITTRWKDLIPDYKTGNPPRIAFYFRFQKLSANFISKPVGKLKNVYEGDIFSSNLICPLTVMMVNYLCEMVNQLTFAKTSF